MSLSYRWNVVAALFIMLLAAGAPHAARGADFRVRGVVLDRTGAALPQVAITVNKGGARVAAALSNARGEFAFDLPPGHYLVTAALAGFEPLRDQSLEVTDAMPPLQLILDIPRIEQQVIVSATRTETPISHVGSSVTVITREELARSGMLSMADTLRRIPGISMVASGRRGQVTSLFMRGGESKYTKVFVDGIPVNEPGGSFNFATLSTSDVDRIEIVRGPQSALFGSDAISGVIQVFTRRGTKEEWSPGPRAMIEGGQFGTMAYAGGVDGGTDRLDYSVSFARSDTDNQVRNGSFNQETISANLGLRPSSRMELRAVFRSEAGRTGVPGPWAFQPPDPDEYYRFRNLAGALSFTHETTTAWRQRITVSANDSHQLSEDPSDSGPFTPEYEGKRAAFAVFDFPFRTLNRTRRERLSYQSDVMLPWGHQLTLGSDLERESGTIGDPSVDPLRARRRNFGGFIQEQWAFRNRLFASAGVRIENNESFGLKSSPRAAIAMHLHQPGADMALGLTKLRASFGRGIKEPTLLESFSQSPYFRGNPDLKAEESSSWDLGLEQHFGTGRGVLDVGYFASRFRNQIAYYVTDYSTFAGTFGNLGRTEASGMEISARQRVISTVEVAGAYTLTVSKIVESTNSFDPVFAKGNALLRRPRHAGFVELLYRPGRWTLSGDALFTGSRVDSDFSGLHLTRNLWHVTVNLMASYRLASRIECYAALENARNDRYMEVLGYPALPRHFRVGIRAGY